MKFVSDYWTCKCGESMVWTLDIGTPIALVKNQPRIPVLYVYGCQECGYQKNIRLMIINPATQDISDVISMKEDTTKEMKE
jgi:hypothetical protein